MNKSLFKIDSNRVQQWLEEAGQIATSRQKCSQFAFKSDNTLVTDVDRTIEEFLVKNIKQYYPGHQIIAEESGAHGNSSEFLWAIDPIDGTRAYASSLPVWGISIGVFYDEMPYAGWLYMPATQERYWGMLDSAFFNSDALPYNDQVNIQSPFAFIAVPSNVHLFYAISFPRVRSFGSTSAHLAYVARGTATAALTRPVRIWDLAAVLPILSAVGIGLVYLSGNPFLVHDLLDGRLSSESIVAAPSGILDEIRERISIVAPPPSKDST